MDVKFIPTSWKVPRAVSCGKCPECLEIKRMEWYTRLYFESKVHTGALFVTLTYKEAPPLGVEKKHVQDFLKRFRHKSASPIKYFIIGEYGGRFKRPHYHMLLFGYHGKRSEIQNAWQMGHIHVGKVEPASINYCAAYHLLKTNTPEGQKPSFMLVSKGMGLNYVATAKEWHQDISKNYCQVFQQKLPLPRYYKEKIYTKQQIDFIKSFYDSHADKIAKISKIMERYGYDQSEAIQHYKSAENSKKKNFKTKLNQFQKL